jgi:hypothetical protein
MLRSGKPYACINAQRKRNFALFRRMGGARRFDRREFLSDSPMPTKYLLCHAAGFSPRYLEYNTGLLCLSGAPHWRYRVFQWLARLFGPAFVKVASGLWCQGHRLRQKSPAP